MILVIHIWNIAQLCTIPQGGLHWASPAEDHGLQYENQGVALHRVGWDKPPR